MRTRLALTLAPLAMLAAFIAGCQSTSLQRCVTAEGLYSASLETATAGRNLGKIDDATAGQIERYRQTAAVALDAMWASALAKDSAGFDGALGQFNSAVDALIALEANKGLRPGAKASG